MTQITFREAVRQAVHEEMARDPTVIIMGTDVGPVGASMGEILGTFEKFGPERVRETPISEPAIVGAAIGAAAGGMRPIAEVTFVDFLHLVTSAIINQLTTMRWLHRGKVKMPVTIRTMTGGGMGTAFQHSKCNEGMFGSIPGLKIVLPSTPYDCKGILKAAIRDDGPVLFLEHRKLLKSTETGPVPDDEYLVPIGKADVKRAGSDVTVVATMVMVHKALAAAERLEEKGISVEVVDPRSFVPLDMDTILASVRKTGRLLVVHDAPRRGGVGAEIVRRVVEEGFDLLKKPPKVLGSLNTPMPYSAPLEDACLPQTYDIEQAVRAMIK